MTATHAQPGPMAQADESRQWMPPRRLRRYAVARIVGGVLFGAIFAGWLVIQWSNPTMRWLAGGLLLVTAWVTAASIAHDARRARGRQITVTRDALEITNHDRTMTLRFADVVEAEWREQDAAVYGLSFYGADGRVLARLNDAVVETRAEARAFLGWLRQHADVTFPVHWPPVQ